VQPDELNLCLRVRTCPVVFHQVRTCPVVYDPSGHVRTPTSVGRGSGGSSPAVSHSLSSFLSSRCAGRPFLHEGYVRIGASAGWSASSVRQGRSCGCRGRRSGRPRWSRRGSRRP
jgi:hypothetical protein